MTTEELKAAVKEEVDALTMKWLYIDLDRAIYKTRQEPGLPIREIAHIIENHFSEEEIKALKNYL